MSVTAFIGAGVVLNIGGPRTDQLTSAVRLRQQWDGVPNSNARVPAIQQIADALDRYFATQSVNFEDIFHAVESLISLATGLGGRAAKAFKPAIGAFVAPSAGTNLNPLILNQARDHIVEEVANHIVAYVDGFQPNAAHRWFSDFWQAATQRRPWDIAILNYDNCIEESLGTGAWDDGFTALDPGIFRFDPMRILNSTVTRILHLHGSVFYGYPHFTDPNRFLFQDQHEDLYRFDSHVEARRYWFGRSRPYNQSGEQATAGPIITGQRKPDKLLGLPYSTYQTVLHNALLNNSRLLIAGYGCGDLHFNSLLRRLTRIHDDNRRVVLIDFVPTNLRGANWCPDWSVRGWPNGETLQSLQFLGRESRPLEGRYRHPWISTDGRCRVYLEGFQDAVQNHGTDIINFLTT